MHPPSNLLFTPPTPFPSAQNSLPSCTTFCTHRPLRHTLPKRHRLRQTAPITLQSDNEIPGGPAPDFSDEPQTDVEYFDTKVSTSSSTTPSPTQKELPLFPLRMVLNPGTPVPLHIFELRYRLLFNRIHDGNSRFGIVLFDPESSSLASIGCAAELTRFEPLPDGRILTNNIGRERFKILSIIDEKPYTRAIVEQIYDEEPKEDLTTLMEEVWITLQDVLKLSNKLYDKSLDLSPDIKRLAPGGEADSDQSLEKTKDGWPSPRRLEDFSFAVCQVLDMPLKEQQILLQIRDTGRRLRRQNKMLQTARNYLAAQSTIKDAGLSGF